VGPAARIRAAILWIRVRPRGRRGPGAPVHGRRTGGGSRWTDRRSDRPARRSGRRSSASVSGGSSISATVRPG